jgi:hypothetical protein
VAAIASNLIAEHHTQLAEAPIVYVFREQATRSKGRLVLGRARRITGLNAFLVALAAGDVSDDESEEGHDFFVMEITQDMWATATEVQKAALIDHELSHFAIDTEKGSFTIRGHDIEEFAAVVARHGLWQPDLEVFAGACLAGGL